MVTKKMSHILELVLPDYSPKVKTVLLTGTADVLAIHDSTASTPDDYLFNLIAMTSPEAKRLWRRSIKEHFDHTCIYCGKTYDLSQLSIDHVHPRSRGGEDAR